MVWTIARRELTEQLTSLRFLIVVLLVLGLTPVAVYVGARDYASRLTDYGRLMAEKQELAVQRRAEVDGVRGGGDESLLRVVRPPEPLSVMVHGLDGALPAYWSFSAAGIEAGPPASRSRRLADVLGALDMEFLVRVALGLLAILLAFDTVAGEKELGTLRAVFSHPLARATFLAGKLAAGAATLLIALGLAFPLALLAATGFGVGLAAPDALARAGVLAGTSAVYLISLYAFGVLVSSVASSQKTSLIVLLVVWLVAALAVPPLATLAAQAMAPAPPVHQVEAQKRALSVQLDREASLAMGAVFWEVTGLPQGHMNTGEYWKKKETLDRRVVPILLSYLNKRRQLVSQLERDAERREARQNEWARLLMALSPAASFARVASDLAGTGDEHAAAWLQAIRRHQTRLNLALFDDPPWMVFSDGRASGWIPRRKPPALSSLPAFVPPRRDAEGALERALPGLGLLALYAALFVAGGFMAFARYDVR